MIIIDKEFIKFYFYYKMRPFTEDEFGEDLKKKKRLTKK